MAFEQRLHGHMHHAVPPPLAKIEPLEKTASISPSSSAFCLPLDRSHSAVLTTTGPRSNVPEKTTPNTHQPHGEPPAVGHCISQLHYAAPILTRAEPSGENDTNIQPTYRSVAFSGTHPTTPLCRAKVEPSGENDRSHLNRRKALRYRCGQEPDAASHRIDPSATARSLMPRLPLFAQIRARASDRRGYRHKLGCPPPIERPSTTGQGRKKRKFFHRRCTSRN